MLTGDTSTQTVAVIKNEGDLATRFQVVNQSATDAAPTVVKAFQNQGDVVCWLANNGYQWVPDTANPQLWVKP